MPCRTFWQGQSQLHRETSLPSANRFHRVAVNTELLCERSQDDFSTLEMGRSGFPHPVCRPVFELHTVSHLQPEKSEARVASTLDFGPEVKCRPDASLPYALGLLRGHLGTSSVAHHRSCSA